MVVSARFKASVNVVVVSSQRTVDYHVAVSRVSFWFVRVTTDEWRGPRRLSTGLHDCRVLSVDRKAVG